MLPTPDQEILAGQLMADCRQDYWSTPLIGKIQEAFFQAKYWTITGFRLAIGLNCDR